jgi:acyl-CoA reductase-like NAD-dependent aldehyde dehydrogenase
MREYQLLIDGEWIATDERDEVRSPFSGDVVGSIPVATAQHADQAVDAAVAALGRGAPPQHERAEMLEKARELLGQRAEDFARCIAEESGKPVKTATAEVARAQDTLLFSAIEARRLAGTVVPFEGSSQGAGKLGFTLFHPKGVVAAITPFNFPLNLVMHKLAPAFAAGCPVVLKPAGNTPLTAYLLAETLLDAGWPKGFLNVITGVSSDVGPVMTGRPEIAVISFTGSTGVGHSLQENNPHTPVLMELGNNTPVIIDASADVELAASRLAATAYSYAGQSCISAQRVYVHQEVKDSFLEALVEKVAALKVGDPLDPDTDVGPLIRTDDRDRIVGWIQEAQEAGAKLRLGGEVNDDGTLQPAILDDVTPDMKVSREEVFGPVLAVQPVADLDEAIALANDSCFGLQAGIFTGDYSAAMRAARELVYGGVTVNESPTFRADQQPYGGVRDSGNTREGPAWSVRDYLEETVVIFQVG